ncbi:MAG: class IV adenylate cyclase [Bacteroidota bacterium]
MKETEAKILEVDRPALERKLRALGATISFDDELYAIYYDRPEGPLRAAGKVLRIRKEGPEVVLAYKAPVPGSDPALKVREEIEVTVSDFDALRTILEGTGHTPVLRMRKHRVQWDLGPVHVVFDDYLDEQAHIPVFVEIEAPDAESLYRTAEVLGYGKGDLKNWSAAELFVHYAR